MRGLADTLSCLTGMCLLAAMADCVSGDQSEVGGLKVLCGSAAALSIVRLIDQAIRNFL